MQAGRVFQRGVEPPFRSQILDEFLAILARERCFERAFRNGFRQQFGGVAAPVGARFAQPHFRKTLTMHERRFIRVGERGERDSELATVGERRRVMVRNAHRPGVEEEPVVEAAHLA